MEPLVRTLHALKIHPEPHGSTFSVLPALSSFQIDSPASSSGTSGRRRPTPLVPFLRGGGLFKPLAPPPREDLRAGSVRVHKIAGDGRCMFRAMVRSLAAGKGRWLSGKEETREAELLREACYDALCRSTQRLQKFPDARTQIIYGYGDVKDYCRQLAKPTFWGGEVEIMVIARMLKVPIFVYQPKEELTEGREHGFQELIRFGDKYTRDGRNHKGRRPVRLLYTGGNHYDLLLD